MEVPHCLEYRSQFGDVQDYGVRAANAIEEVILREGADTVGALVLEPITAGGGVITLRGLLGAGAGNLQAVRNPADHR